MKYTEEVVTFGQHDNLTGILTIPGNSLETQTGVVLLNAGLVHKVGPNRAYVHLARALASSGIWVFRFDFSGFGDSAANPANISFVESSIEEALLAAKVLEERYGIRRVILGGICSGADIALRTTIQHPSKIKGLLLINGAFLGNNALQHLHHVAMGKAGKRYRKKYLFSFTRWQNILRGKSKLLQRVLSKSAKANESVRQNGSPDVFSEEEVYLRADLLLNTQAKIILIYSEGSETLDIYDMMHKTEVTKLQQSGAAELHVVKDIDHVFTPEWSHKLLIDLAQQWLTRNFVLSEIE